MTPPSSPPRVPGTVCTSASTRSKGSPRALDHLLGSRLGGAAGGVDLAGVVELDDLGVVEEARGLAGEVHQQHRADGEVGRDDDAEFARRCLLAEFVEEGGGEAGGADDEANAPFEGGLRKDRGPGGVGEIDDDLGLVGVEGGASLAVEGQALAGIAFAEGVDEGEGFGGGIGGGGEGHLAAHAAASGDNNRDGVHDGRLYARRRSHDPYPARRDRGRCRSRGTALFCRR